MKFKTIGLWLLKILVALVFAAAGIAKLSSQPMLVAEFHTIGLGEWFRYFTGAMELVSAGLLLVPKTALLGAAALTLVSVGALLAQAFMLHGDVLHTLVFIAVTGFLTWTERGRLNRGGAGLLPDAL